MQFFFAVFSRGSSDIANLFPAIMYAQIIDLLSDLSRPDVSSKVLTLFILWILAILYYRIFHAVAKYYGFKTAMFASLDAKLETIRHIFKLDLSWHELENTGNKIKRIDNGQRGINDIIRGVFNIVIEATINIISISIIFFTIDWKISLAILVYAIIYVVAATKSSVYASKRYRDVSKSEENVEGLTFESVNNIRSMKILLLNNRLGQKISGLIGELKNFFRKYLFITRIRNTGLDMITRVFDFGITIYLALNIIKGVEYLAALILFRSLFWKIMEAVDELSELYHEVLISKIYISRMMDLKNTRPTIEAQTNQKAFPVNWNTLEMNSINFSYGSKPVLEDLDLKIKRGEKIGIVGISGAGKSTFFKLLLDLYEDYKGEILYDGISLREIQREDYLNFVSAVAQDTELFNATLKDNILLGTIDGREVSDLELDEVIKSAYLQDVVEKLPQGMNTMIGEKGFKLSGGERQRVGIARAIIRKPQILLLDEATSHLDTQSEELIQKSLNNIFKGLTAVVIAHRLSTIQNMDRIIVLKDGRIVEQGNLDELLSLKGEFAKLWGKQQLN